MASLSELVSSATGKLEEQKFCSDFIRKYSAIWRKLLVFTERHQITELSWEFACMFFREEYGIDIEESDIYQVGRKKLHYTTVRPVLFLLILQNGAGWIRTQRLSAVSLEAYSDIIDRYISSCMEKRYKQSTIDGRMWTVRPFLMYLQQSGIDSTVAIKNLSKEDVSGFIKFLTARALSSISDKLSVLRSFLQFLYENQYVESDLSIYVPKASRRKQRLAHTWTEDEKERMLNAIERGTSLGKRDYAMLLLATDLGMRTGDIVSLQFENIDWAQCRIHFIQEKTEIPQELPLSEEIGKAIIDYMKNGRPNDSSPFVFLRHTPPYGKMNSFWYPMQRYLKIAKIPVSSEKPHGPHTLRFSLATQMMDAGIEYETISAVLGHSNPASTNRYLRADIEKLRLCALNPEEVLQNG